MVNTSEKLPEVRHLYQDHSMDSSRWDFFTPRADDIVVATSYKAGTIWVQAIIGNLIFAGGKLPDQPPDRTAASTNP
jgi:aryl sulfotransferase